jgi:hypothetical protein
MLSDITALKVIEYMEKRHGEEAGGRTLLENGLHFRNSEAVCQILADIDLFPGRLERIRVCSI